MEFRQEFILIQDTPIGDLQIRYYGIIIVIALLIAAWVASRLARDEKLDPDHIWGALTWAIIPGIILARLWFVLFPPISLTSGCAEGRDPCRNLAWFLQNIDNLQVGPLAIWSGGLSIFGAVIGGLLGAYLYMRKNRLDIPVWLDIAAVAMPLGQAIGRFANYVNQELYGTVTTLPWGIRIDSAHRVREFASMVEYPYETTRFHPLFLYESLWSLMAFVVLLYLFRNYRGYSRLKTGDLFLLYLLQYSFVRFLLEFIRVEVSVIPGTVINTSQVTVAIVFIVAVAIFLYRRRSDQVDAKQMEQLAKEP